MKRCIAYLVCLMLTGCAGDQRNQQNVEQDRIGLGLLKHNHVPAIDDLEPRSDGTLAAVKELKSETQASNNATQQSLTGFGLQVSKIAEKVDASLVKVEAHVDQKLEATANVTAQAMASLRAEIRAELHAEISAELHASAQATASAVADLKAQLSVALTNVQALRADIQHNEQTNSAGRDVSTQVIQFGKDQADVMAKAFDSNVRTMEIVCGILIGLSMVQSRSERKAIHEMTRETFGIVKVMAHLAAQVDDDPARQSRKETKRVEKPKA